MHVVLRHRPVVHDDGVHHHHGVAGRVGDHVDVGDVVCVEPPDLPPLLHGAAVTVEDEVWSEGGGVVHHVVVQGVVRPDLSPPVRAGLHGDPISQRIWLIIPGKGEADWIDHVDQGVVSGGDIGGVVGVLGSQSPEDDVGVVVHVKHPSHHLRERPILGSHASNGDAGHQFLRLHTPVVVSGLDHPAAEENLPGGGEGDLVELPPAVHQLAVPPLLGPEPFLTGAVLDVGAHQPTGQRGVLLPGQREVVEGGGLVSEELLPTLAMIVDKSLGTLS